MARSKRTLNAAARAPETGAAATHALTRDRASRLAFWLVVACFFLSGAAALTLEMVWSRSLRLVFGSSTLAISTVLVAYMLGLGLGGLVGGRIAGRLRRGVRAYGWIEIAIGAYALSVPWWLGHLPPFESSWFAASGFWAGSLLRFAAVLAILLLPTVLMGATLPVLVATVARRHEAIAGRVGLLYGVNTLGAVAGVVGATFLLFPTVGLWYANVAGAMIAACAGVIALIFVAPRVEIASTFRHEGSALRPDVDAAATSRPKTKWSPLALSYAVVGFTALAYEVCWSRALAMVLGSSIYAFATMLAAFLAGIALGSLVSRRWWDRVRSPQAVYAVGIGVLGIAAWGTSAVLGELPRIFVRLVDIVGITPGAVLAVNAGTSLVAMLAPTLVLGALFPLLLRALARDERETHRTVGDIYFANTIGCAVGAFTAGFVLIPGLGLQRSTALLVFVNLIVAAALLWWQRQWVGNGRGALAAVLAILALTVAIAPPRWRPGELNRGVYQLLLDADEWRVAYEPILGVEPEGLLLYREGINTTVSVERRQGELVLRVNGKPDAGSAGDMPTQVLAGQIPMLFGPKRERILVIGLASGVTVGSIALHDPSEIDVIELEPSMVEASRHFDHLNHRPLERRQTRVVVDDGRTFLARRPPAYDMVVSEPSNPWISGVANLFTREFFRAARDALTPDGVLLQWVQLYGITPDAWASILAAMRESFPYLYVFSPGTSYGDSLVLGAQRPLGPDDFPRWEGLSPEVQADLWRIGIASTTDLWSLLQLGPAEVAELAASAPVVNSDDNMFVELTSPFALHDRESHDTIRERVAAIATGIPSHLEAAGMELAAAERGDLALAYATRRGAARIAKRMLAGRAGVEAHAVMLDALLRSKARNDPAAVDDVRRGLDRAVAMRPELPSLRWYRAVILHDLGEHDAALRDLDRVLAQEPQNVRARALRVSVLFALRRMDAARAAAVPLIATRYVEHDWDLLPLAAASALEIGDIAGGIDDLRRYLELRPNDAYNWNLLHEALRVFGDQAGAEQARENAARARRNASREMYINALRFERLGQPELARVLLQNAIEQMPDLDDARAVLRRIEASVAAADG